MAALESFCLSATTFAPTGEVDEEAQAAYLDRFVESNIGVYLGSGGNGEGHALHPDELRRVYEIGVSVCKGRVPVQANLPETHTPRAAVEQARLAFDAGIEVVHMYTLEQRHGMRPTDAEYTAYFETVLAEIRQPVVLCVNPNNGYLPPAPVVAALCGRHHQIVGIRSTNTSAAYLVGLKDAVSREDLRYYAILADTPTALALGFDGIFGGKANLVPRTVRRFMDLCETGDVTRFGPLYEQLMRLHSHVMRWHPAGARWIKMGMRALSLPGAEGGVRPPYLIPGDEEMAAFAAGLRQVGIAEIDERLGA